MRKLDLYINTSEHSFIVVFRRNNQWKTKAELLNILQKQFGGLTSIFDNKICFKNFSIEFNGDDTALIIGDNYDSYKEVYDFIKKIEEGWIKK